MDLKSSKDKILISKCISVKKQKILYAKNIVATEKNTLLYHYDQLFDFLSSNDISSFVQHLKAQDYDLIQEEPKTLAKKYTDITKQLYMDSGKYSDEKFQEFLDAFYKGNEKKDFCPTCRIKRLKMLLQKLEEEAESEAQE